MGLWYSKTVAHSKELTMRAFDENDDPESCWNRAGDEEMLFVLLGRDPAAPVAIDAWIQERIKLGLNTHDDEQIAEARECAATMAEEGRKHVPS